MIGLFRWVGVVVALLAGCGGSEQAGAPAPEAPLLETGSIASPQPAARTDPFTFCQGTGVDLAALGPPDLSAVRALQGTWINAQVAGRAGTICKTQPAVLIRAGFQAAPDAGDGTQGAVTGGSVLRFTCADPGTTDVIVHSPYAPADLRGGRAVHVERSDPAFATLIWIENGRLNWVYQTPGDVCLYGRADRAG